MYVYVNIGAECTRMRPVNYLAIVLLCVTLGVPISGAAKSLSGAYLAARQADLERDYRVSEQYYTCLLYTSDAADE